MASTVALVTKPTPYEERILEFKGLNRKAYVEEGEMSDMKNLTADRYPLLCPRKLRGTHALPDGVKKPYSIITKYERIAMIAEKKNGSIAFYYDGKEIPSVTGLSADTEMVAINTKICFFPQKTYLSLTRSSDSVTIREFGRLDAYKDVESGAVAISNIDTKITVGSGHGIVKGDAVDIVGTFSFGKDYALTSTGNKVSVCSQSDGTGGDILLPEGVKFCGIKKDDNTAMWLVAASDNPFTLRQYRQNDGVLEGVKEAQLLNGRYVAWTWWTKPAPVPMIECYQILSTGDPERIGMSLLMDAEANVSCDVRGVNASELTLPRDTFIELIGQAASDITFTGTVKREIPDIHHVIEWNNRLWGASDKDNTIYACKLGDPKNWKYYQGTSLDSYYAQQGTDENWTGCAAYSSHLIFFKQNSMTRIYGTSPSSFQISNTVCYGVEQGSSKSVVVINDKVFYKSTIGIMAYEGGTPYSITEKLNMKFKNVVGGTEGIKYYASIQKEDDTYELMVLDIDKAVWHKEDEIRFRDCCTLDGRLYFISDEAYGSFEADKVYVINPEEASEKLYDRDWMAVFGPFDEYVENQKIYSKMSLRFIAQPRTRVNVYIKMDDGDWEIVRKFEYTSTSGEDVPIIPRRCDRFSIKVSGKGDCEIKSLTRRFRRGSGVRI